MIKNILRLVILGVTVYGISKIVPGFVINSPQPVVTIGLIVLVLVLIHLFVKPILKVLTFPITIITLGLFSLILNAFFILLVAWIVPGFQIETFTASILSALIIAVVNFVIG